MPRTRRSSPQTIKVLAELAREPRKNRYGYELSLATGLSSGSLYPILIRLADLGLLKADWEPGPPGRPPRHLYQLTADGLRRAVEFGQGQDAPRRVAKEPT